jgi:hypothetical protein
MYAYTSLVERHVCTTVKPDSRQEESSQYGIEVRHRTAWSQRDDIRDIDP